MKIAIESPDKLKVTISNGGNIPRPFLNETGSDSSQDMQHVEACLPISTHIYRSNDTATDNIHACAPSIKL